MIDTPTKWISRALVLEPAELREDPESDGRTLVGHFATFNSPTEIRSSWEGPPFIETIAPGAFSRTLSDRSDQVRCIYGHGSDPLFGSKPIGTPRSIVEDELGARYTVDLYRNADIDGWIIPAARDGQLGASFAFDVVSEEWDHRPADGGLPVRTITEAKLYEFGPCPFPAYSDATAGVRSVLASWTDLSDGRREELSALLATAGGTAYTFESSDTRTGAIRIDAAPDSDLSIDSDDLRSVTDATARRARAIALINLRKGST